MYAHPGHFSGELVKALALQEKILKYIDLPLQHISDSVLKKMNRRTDGGQIKELIHNLRESIPGIIIRTTFIVGFPGETDNDFGQLLDFCEETMFDNVGLFKYSSEEGTPAYKFKGRVELSVAEERYLTLLALQNKISKAKLGERIGKSFRVMIQEIVRDGSSIGRAWFQAPDVDGVTYVHAGKAKPGDMIDVEITAADAYDLHARPLEED